MKKSESAESASPSIDLEKIREVASHAAEVATKFIKKHPLECVGGALVVGIFIGLLINRK